MFRSSRRHRRMRRRVRSMRRRSTDAAVAAVAAKPTKIVVGDHTSCAILADATLRCWGKNNEGQLGIGTTIDSAKPVMPNLRGVIDVVLGSAHACALLDDRSVTCWGRINFGHKENLLLTGRTTRPREGEGDLRGRQRIVRDDRKRLARVLGRHRSQRSSAARRHDDRAPHSNACRWAQRRHGTHRQRRTARRWQRHVREQRGSADEDRTHRRQRDRVERR